MERSSVQHGHCSGANITSLVSTAPTPACCHTQQQKHFLLCPCSSFHLQDYVQNTFPCEERLSKRPKEVKISEVYWNLVQIECLTD